MAERYRAAYRQPTGVKVLPVGPSGHVIMEDQPVRFAEQLRNFLT